MSFEGYYQILCSNGHYDTVDVYLFSEESWRCPYCREPARWRNTVDVTNGTWGEDPNTGETERIDNFIDLEIKNPAPHCDKCGQSMGPCTYHIPQKLGHLLEVKIKKEEDNDEFEGEDR